MRSDFLKGLFIDKKKTKENLYTKILVWAYERQETGFTIEEIRSVFSLTQEQDTWMRKIFLTTSDQDRKYFEYFKNDETTIPNRHYYSLNEKGITAAMNYKALIHAEESSSLALFIAAASMFFTAFATGIEIGYKFGFLFHK